MKNIHFKIRWYIYLILTILIILLIFVFLRIKANLNVYAEKWFAELLREKVNLDISWDRFELDIPRISLNIEGLSSKFNKGGIDTRFWFYCEGLRLSLNPYLLIKQRIVEIQHLDIEGLTFDIKVSENERLSDLKAMILKNGHALSGGGGSFQIKDINVQGKNFSLDLIKNRAHLSLGDFNLKSKWPGRDNMYPLQIVFNNGEIEWRDINRDLGAGGIRCSIDNNGVFIHKLNVIINGEGSLGWSGEIKRQDNTAFIDGNYSGELFSNSVAVFLKPFKRMRGKVISNGHVSGVWKKLKIDASLQSPDFFWKKHNFKDVKGHFSYQGGILNFTGMKCIWREGALYADSEIFLKEHKANIRVSAKGLPTLRLFRGWNQLFPIRPPLWEGNIDWHIIWPEKHVKHIIELSLNAPLMTSVSNSLGKGTVKTRFSADTNQILFDTLNILMANNNIKAKGTYNIKSKNIDLVYTCNIVDKGLVKKIWGAPIEARGSLDGKMDGLLNDPRLQGVIEAEAFNVRGYLLDNLNAHYLFKGHRLFFEKAKGGLKEALFAGNGSIGLPPPKDSLDLALSWSVEGLPLTEVLAHIHYDSHLIDKGTKLSGKGDLIFKKGKPSASGQINTNSFNLLGQSGINVTIPHFNASGEEILFKGIKAKSGDGSVTGDISYNMKSGWIFDLEGKSWNVTPLIMPSGDKIQLSAVLNFLISGGTNEFQGSFAAKDFTYKVLQPINITGDLCRLDDELRCTINHPWGKGEIDISLVQGLPFTARANMAKLLISDPNMGLMDANSSYSLLVDGDLELKGLLKEIKSTTGRFDGNEIRIAGPFGELKNTDRFEILLKDKRIIIPSLNMISDNGNLTFKGYWGSDMGFDINAKGFIPLELFQKRLSGVKVVSGITQVNLNLKGTKDSPQFQGDILISKGTILLPQYNFRLDNIVGWITLSKHHATIQKMSAETRGGGWIELNGRMNYQNLEGDDALDLTANFEDVYLYKKDTYRAYLEGILQWKGGLDSSKISGMLLLGEARYTGYKNLLQLLLTKKRSIESKEVEPIIKGKEDTQGIWSRISGHAELDIELDLGDDFWVKSPFYNASLVGNPILKGALIEPFIIGDVEVAEGEVYLGSQAFYLASGHIKLNNPESADSTINALALSDINGLRLRLSVFGPLKNPRLQFTSVPFMPQQEILNMVFFGISTQEGGERQQENDLLSLMISTTSKVMDDVFGEKISYYTGLDMLRPSHLPGDLFKVDILDFAIGEKGAGIERLTVGKTLTKRFKIKYSRLSGEEKKEVAEAEYKATDYITLIGSQDDQGTYSFDINFGFEF